MFLLAGLDAGTDRTVKWGGFVRFLIEYLLVNRVNKGIITIFAF